jgi:hypothetical protein
MHNKGGVNGWMERAIRELPWRPPLNKPPTKLSSAETIFDTVSVPNAALTKQVKTL